ncbi:MAG: replication-associated recombination protein A [Candidatus Methanomethylophilaceae archaeon]|nr:replication-associated recombination protein A [Candidatus Methanomethylophilaceae archaeon]
MKQMLLVEEPNEDVKVFEPLASRMRPRDLEEYAGQRHLLAKGKLLRNLIESDNIPSMILWGPPGVGKTTLASIIAERTDSRFIKLSAMTSGIKEVREVMERAESSRRNGKKTILFLDEIHRFNKAQQDVFLPFVEKGSVILIGATTENPSFEVNSALLSRCRVFVLHPLEQEDLEGLLERAIHDPRGFGDYEVAMPEGMVSMIADFSKGDGRTALNTLETILMNGDLSERRITVTMDGIKECISRKSMMYDKGGEEHNQVISAFHESIRNSDVDAALFWLARMLDAGEDPVWIARRMTHAAAEDIGLADTNALHVAVDCFDAVRLIGMPECAVHLAEAAMYLCLAPKSNSVILAYGAARKDAETHDTDPIPLAVRAAYTKLQKDLGYGKDYQYPHSAPDKITDMQCMPDSLVGTRYYRPSDQG